MDHGRMKTSTPEPLSNLSKHPYHTSGGTFPLDKFNVHQIQIQRGSSEESSLEPTTFRYRSRGDSTTRPRRSNLVGTIKGEKEEWKRKLPRNSLIDHKRKVLFKAHHRKPFDAANMKVALAEILSLFYYGINTDIPEPGWVNMDVSSKRVIFHLFQRRADKEGGLMRA
ncbi:hypothetical protein AVEN_109340-1 [Araneus ventricosus]|uniref:Uncharacterized protein n=1 Tax=Araneus ventricosus TaxID=182803 RepID=A0A4Y2D3K8_ARAVE|nr:hypothetical protein AVEN_109340-1 [Araneus ventricosus]